MESARLYSKDEEHKIGTQLETNIPFDQVSSRTGFNNLSVFYIEGWKTISIANKIFGFNGWSSSIVNTAIDFVDVTDGRISIGVSCTARVALKDGSFHEDIGYGSSENQRSKALAYQKAKKEAVTDATKRALRYFGNALGNCMFDKQYIRNLRDSSRARAHRTEKSLPSKILPDEDWFCDEELMQAIAREAEL